MLRLVVESRLRAPAAWPYNDRIVAWLLPNLRADIRRFHSSNGPAMKDIFEPTQLKTIDNSCVTLLAVRVERIEPGLMMAIRNLATQNGQ
jgi:hypothetical protein